MLIVLGRAPAPAPPPADVVERRTTASPSTIIPARPECGPGSSRALGPDSRPSVGVEVDVDVDRGSNACSDHLLVPSTNRQWNADVLVARLVLCSSGRSPIGMTETIGKPASKSRPKTRAMSLRAVRGPRGLTPHPAFEVVVDQVDPSQVLHHHGAAFVPGMRQLRLVDRRSCSDTRERWSWWSAARWSRPW